MSPTLQVIAPDRRAHTEAMLDLIAKTFPVEGYFGWLGWIQGAGLVTGHYDWAASRIGLLDGQLVTHYGVWDVRMRIGDAVVRVGGIGCVATHAHFRKRGFMEQTARASVDAMRVEGYDLSLLFGIPNFYHKFGYTNAWAETTYVVNLSELPAACPPVRPRTLHMQKLPAWVAACYNAEHAGLTGTAVRPTYRAWDIPWKAQGVWWTGADGAPAGYLIYSIDGGTLSHQDSAGDVDTRLHVLADLARRACCPELRCFGLHHDSPLARRLRQLSSRQELAHRPNGGALVRVMHLPTLLEKMAGEFTRRLQRHLGCAWTGALRLSTREDAATLLLDANGVRVAPPVDTPHAIDGGDALAQLLLGADDPHDIARATGMTLTGDAPRLLDTLFPPQHPMLGALDRF